MQGLAQPVSALMHETKDSLNLMLRDLFREEDTDGFELPVYVAFDDVKPLLVAGADPTMKFSPWGYALSHLAIKYHWGLEALMWLADRGVRLDALDNNGKKPIHTACETHGFEAENIALWLMEQDVRFDMIDNSGETTLMLAAGAGHWRLFNKLKAEGVASEWQAKSNPAQRQMLLHHAVIKQSKLPIVVEAIRTCSDIEAEHPQQRRSALKAAVMSGQVDKAKLLLDRGANMHSGDAQGRASNHARQRGGAMASLFQRYLEMPALPGKLGGLGLVKMWEKASDLLRTNQHGLAVLDNPDIWQKWPEVNVALEQYAGETVSLELLQYVNDEGKSWLRRGIECFAAEAIVDALHARGEYFPKEALFAEAHDKTALIHHPVAWAFMPTVWQSMQGGGEAWERADWLREDSNGRTALAGAIEAGQLQLVDDWCRAHAEDLCVLLADDRQRGALDALAAIGQVPDIVAHERWRAFDASALQQVLQRLPEEGKEQLPSFHGLLANIQRAQRAKAVVHGRE